VPPGLHHPLVLSVFAIAVATSAVFGWLAVSNAMTLRLLEKRAVRRYIAFAGLGALQAAVVALSFVPMAAEPKVHLFRLMWVLALLSMGAWVRADSAFIGARSRVLSGLSWVFFALSVVPLTDLLLALATRTSFFFSSAPREPASLLIQATGNHYSHALPADLTGLAFTVLILTSAGLLIRRVLQHRPGEWVLVSGIGLTALAASAEAVLAVAGPGWMVPLLFAGNLVEAVRITWSTTRSVGARQARDRHQDVAEREFVAHQLEQLALTRRLAELGSRASELGHDLRNPLTAVSLSLEYAEQQLDRPEPVDREDLAEVFAVARRSLDDATALVQRISASTTPPAEVEEIDLVELARDARALCQHRLQACELTLVPPRDGQVARVRGDRVDLTRVLVNLLVNAAQATAGLEERWVRVEVDVDGVDAVLHVVDAGPTPPAAVLDEMFQRGFTTKARGEGQGLGLAICRRVVTTHGGSLDVDRRAPTTTLCLRLPRAQSLVRSGRNSIQA